MFMHGRGSLKWNKRMARTKIGVRPLREKEKEDKLMLLYIKPVTVLDILQVFSQDKACMFFFFFFSYNTFYWTVEVLFLITMLLFVMTPPLLRKCLSYKIHARKIKLWISYLILVYHYPNSDNSKNLYMCVLFSNIIIKIIFYEFFKTFWN